MNTEGQTDCGENGTRTGRAEISGLLIALVLTTFVWWPPVASRLLSVDLVWCNVAAQGIDWGFTLILLGIVVFWERRPLSSLGFRPLTWSNFGPLQNIAYTVCARSGVWGRQWDPVPVVMPDGPLPVVCAVCVGDGQLL